MVEKSHAPKKCYFRASSRSLGACIFRSFCEEKEGGRASMRAVYACVIWRQSAAHASSSCSAAQQLSTSKCFFLLSHRRASELVARARPSSQKSIATPPPNQPPPSTQDTHGRRLASSFAPSPLTPARACSKLSDNTRLLLLNCPQSRWPTRSTHPTTSTSSTPQEPQIRLPIHRPPRPPPRLLLPQMRATPMLLRPPLRSQTNTTMPKTARILTLPGLCSTSAASTLP